MSNSEYVTMTAFETVMARMERTIKRLWILCLVLVVLLVGSNIAWIVYESQFETVSVEQDVEQRADSGNNYVVGGDFDGVSEGPSEDNIP